jgi:hypothetical protein
MCPSRVLPQQLFIPGSMLRIARFLQSKTPLLLRLWQGRFPFQGLDAKPVILGVTKSSKTRSWAFPKRGHVDTYASHPRALPGSPSQEASERNRSARYQALAEFVSGLVFEGEATV